MKPTTKEKKSQHCAFLGNQCIKRLRWLELSKKVGELKGQQIAHHTSVW